MTDIIANTTLRDLWESQARLNGSKTFLIFHDANACVTEFTYQQFDDEINRTANLFAAKGIQKGARVALHLCNSPEFMMCLFGLAKLGAVAVPMNDHSSLEECRYVLEKCTVKIVVLEQRFITLYTQLACEGLISQGILVTRSDEHFEGAENFNHLKDACAATLDTPIPLTSEDVAEILFTSGTTSKPKGVILTHCNLLFSGVYGVWQTSLRGDDRLLTTMPACHSNFQLAALTPVITAGATLILLERYSARRFWQQVIEAQATVTQCVSMMVRTLLLQPVAVGERAHHLREILYFLPLSNDEKHEFEERFAVRLMNSYGSTESVTWVITDPPSGQRRWPSVGRVGLSYEAKIVDEAGHELAPGETGEFCIKGIPGRTLAQGYLDDPNETAKLYREDGWMYTGDKGYVDEDGWFYFVDRKVNMIKRAGENISTTEIEAVLIAHPLIAEAAVIGVVDPIRDEAIKAFVLPCEGATLTTSEITDYCRMRLAEYKVPSFIELCTSFPRTCSMKIEKKLLK